LNRLTTAFRIFTVIPISIVLASVSGTTVFSPPGYGEHARYGAIDAGGLLSSVRC
jgi:hypothetical protein